MGPKSVKSVGPLRMGRLISRFPRSSRSAAVVRSCGCCSLGLRETWWKLGISLGENDGNVDFTWFWLGEMWISHDSPKEHVDWPRDMLEIEWRKLWFNYWKWRYDGMHTQPFDVGVCLKNGICPQMALLRGNILMNQWFRSTILSWINGLVFLAYQDWEHAWD